MVLKQLLDLHFAMTPVIELYDKLVVTLPKNKSVYDIRCKLNTMHHTIDPDILRTWGATSKKYRKGEYVFNEGDAPRNFFQLLEGSVKLFNINNEGREYTQGIFTDGQSFGEPPLLIGMPYPSTAMVIKDSIIIKLPGEKLLEILEKNPVIQQNILLLLAKRIYNKSITAKEIVNNTPEQRILGFLNSFKNDHGIEELTLIPYTRQEIANFTGLRVETVIRTLKKMCEEQKVMIKNHKLYFK